MYLSIDAVAHIDLFFVVIFAGIRVYFLFIFRFHPRISLCYKLTFFLFFVEMCELETIKKNLKKNEKKIENFTKKKKKNELKTKIHNKNWKKVEFLVYWFDMVKLRGLYELFHLFLAQFWMKKVHFRLKMLHTFLEKMNCELRAVIWIRISFVNKFRK